jgi:hypothetical protein
LSGMANTTSSNFSNRYVGPTSLTDHIGNFNYTVNLLPPVVPPITGGTTQGGISAQVTVAAFTGGGQGGGVVTASAPEPSALLLAALGLPVAACWRRVRAGLRRAAA